MFESIDLSRRKYTAPTNQNIVYLFVIISASVTISLCLSLICADSTCYHGQLLVLFFIILLENMVTNILYI